MKLFTTIYWLNFSYWVQSMFGFDGQERERSQIY